MTNAMTCWGCAVDSSLRSDTLAPWIGSPLASSTPGMVTLDAARATPIGGTLENVALSTRDGELSARYQKIVGTQTVEIDGEQWAEIHTEVVLQHALQKGQPLPDREQAALLEHDAFETLLKSALSR